jgi:azurin
MISVLVLMIANVGFASSGQIQKAQSYFDNPNRCRVFEAVVDPTCPYDAAKAQCDASLQVFEDLKSQMKLESLTASCKKFHSGNTLERLAEETLMGSSSFDGYTLIVGANSAEVKNADAAVSKASDEDGCQKVAALLNAIGVAANCDQVTVTVSK